MGPEEKRQLLDRLSAWLDEADAPEALPEGLAVAEAPAPLPDLFSFVAQLSALTQEVKLQGRATNRLNTELADALKAMRPPAAPREAPKDKDLLADLLDVRDRLARSLAEAERAAATMTGLRGLFGAHDAFLALVAGDRMTLDRLDDLLHRLSVQEIPSLGLPFDPETMTALEAVATADEAPGTVVEVIRPGYTQEQRIVRFAEVRIAKGISNG